eukprot:g3997.t1
MNNVAIISFGLLALSYSATATEGPCDITAKAGNPCVAAHSTTRALLAAYDGPLYRVTRSSDGKSADVGLLKAGGFADIATQDSFCAKLDCVISVVYDQSGLGNHLGQRHKLVNASQHKIMVGGGTFVYGMWFDPGYGYHVDNTTGVAKGNEPESIYSVMSGTHFNGHCENSVVAHNTSQGAGTMEAIYFGNAHWQGNSGDGLDGPWVGADLECGMYYGGGNRTKVNPQNKPLAFPFVSLYLRGGTDGFALKGGDATSGTLQTMYDGPRPDCAIAGTCQRHGNHTYNVMSKKGAIILATGGDNSNGAQGKWYEGLMVSGTTDDATDDAVQANIVSVGYRNLPTPAPTPPPPATPLGCYVDKKDYDLPVCATKQMATSNTVVECGTLCEGYKYFALENGKECRCGNAYGKHGKAADPAKDCAMPCKTDASTVCGGFWFESVYSH